MTTYYMQKLDQWQYQGCTTQYSYVYNMYLILVCKLLSMQYITKCVYCHTVMFQGV